jgi:hypothetical protein
MTLKERTAAFNKDMRAQRNKLYPKSENLSDLVSNIVAKLEHKFEDIDSRMNVVPSLDASWRDDAMMSTKREIPRIPRTGTETGRTLGFADAIYVNREDLDASSTLPKDLLDANGAWKSSADVRLALQENNPVIPRSYVLKSASGRYSNMLVVDPTNITSNNPTGMVTIEGKPLTRMNWRKSKASMRLGEGGLPESSAGKLLVALIMRTGDPAGVAAKGVAEVVNLQMEKDTGGSALAPRSSGRGRGDVDAELGFFDVGDDSSILTDLKIMSLPTWVFFYGSRLVYAGQIGGRKLRLPATLERKQVLVVEPIFKRQVAMEKTLRKCGCDSYLCLTAGEAEERVRTLGTSSDAHPHPVVFDLVLISDEISHGDLSALTKRLGPQIESGRTICAGLVSVLGEKGKSNLKTIAWRKDFTSDDFSGINSTFAGSISVLLQTPIKSSSIMHLFGLQTPVADDSNFGLTPDTLAAKIRHVQDDIISGRAHGNEFHVGIRLSAEDTQMRGVSLVRRK